MGEWSIMSMIYRQLLSIFVLFFLTFGLLGCAEDFVEEAGVAASSCSEATCLAKNLENLELRVGGGAEIFVGSNESEIMISGDCNAGNYTNTIVTWVLTGPSVGSQSGGGGSCEQGRFNFKIRLGAARKGLLDNSGNRRDHTLVVNLKANNGGQEVGNQSKSRDTVTLHPGL